jgi:hypothetical protein
MTQPKCDCDCHARPIRVRCCSCRAQLPDPCRCDDGRPRRCCGEAGRPDPDDPLRPGWRPGDKPADDPLDGLHTNEKRSRAFDRAFKDILIRGGGPRGPKMGSRKDEYLPYLVVRAGAGDRGKRPLADVFWESPDLFVAENYDAPSAPAFPPTTGGEARASAPNTLWAHVWNLGLSPVYNARVEFYWCDPSLGINDTAATLIGATHVDLGDRYSGRCHTIVKCPTTWVPTYVNGGHECLVVRAFEPLTDPLGMLPWDAARNRHVGQRNIAVVNAQSPAEIQIPLRLGCSAAPGRATIEVHPVRSSSVDWLVLLGGKRDHGFVESRGAREVVGLMTPTPLQSPANRPVLRGIDPKTAKAILRARIDFERSCDELEVILYVGVDGLERGECKVYRVEQRAEGRTVGGYTVIARRV